MNFSVSILLYNFCYIVPKSLNFNFHCVFVNSYNKTKLSPIYNCSYISVSLFTNYNCIIIVDIGPLLSGRTGCVNVSGCACWRRGWWHWSASGSHEESHYFNRNQWAGSTNNIRDIHTACLPHCGTFSGTRHSMLPSAGGLQAQQKEQQGQDTPRSCSGKTFHSVSFCCRFVYCVIEFVFFRLRKMAVPVEISRYSFRVCVCVPVLRWSLQFL